MRRVGRLRLVAKVKEEEEGQDVNHIPGTSLSSERVARTTRPPTVYLYDAYGLFSFNF